MPIAIEDFRVVDFYYQDGTYRRDTIYRNSQHDRSWCDLRSNDEVIAFIKQPLSFEVKEYLHQQVKLYLLNSDNNYDVDYLTDSWLPYDSGKEIQLRRLSRMNYLI